MAWNPGQPLFGDRYIIERKLGEGGVGITYLAKNRRGELRVIKTLREQILNHPQWIPHQDQLRHDFRDEALRLALCRHPHVVQVENVFDEGNLPCMAMEYIEGEDLGKRITNKGALPEGEALQYIRQIGEALILVHEKGLLHRDLKPSNIMMRAGNIHLLSPTTGQLIRTLTGHSEWVNSIAISSDGQILASGSGDKTIKLWSMTTGKEIRTLTGHFGGVWCVAFSPDGQVLASGSGDRTIKLWEVATGKEIHSLTHFCGVTSITFTPDGNWLAAGDSGGNIKIWRSQLVVE
ncbi:serine/threonine protein kinase [Scytonema hofmannii FACHB-248]|uniref:Serine/threonine protein kinase n=1 Tax=Scytonema hofmannii FACHB-248 TaxID=1842502 RepID=A0ABR8GWW8_9CYAN|nr:MULTISPECIES: serine/threonine-protein kinase [Nostocales]MBD2607687.1 serine/threonine protein kinase [Scytonema hofmannii FACHB-248]